MERFQFTLQPNEEVRWTGRPQQGLLMRSSDAFLIPFSIFWCGFAVFWESSVLASNGPAFMKLWGIPFVAIGLYLVIGRFFADAAQRKRTYYAVTSERVLIRSGLFSTTTRSLDLRSLPEITFTVKNDGRGSIMFGSAPRTGFGAGSSNFPFGRQDVTPMFEMIPDAQAVHNVILQVKRERSTAQH